MNENEILDDLPKDNNQEISAEFIQVILSCAKYAKIFVIVSIIYNVVRLVMNFYVVRQYADDIGDIYGGLFWYTMQSMFFGIISFISIYFLWLFSKKAQEVELNGDEALRNILKSLKQYFIATLIVMVFYKAMAFLGPLLGQFVAF